MTSPVSFGFLRPDPKRVVPGRWTVLLQNGEALEDPASIPDWDYFTDLRVVRSLEIDLQGVLADTGLEAGSTVSASIIWHSSWTGLRGASSPVPLRNGENVMELDLPGDLLGGRLTVEARLTLGRAVSNQPLAPRRVGSTLWSDMFRIFLEGTGARFPVVPTAFDEAGLAGGRLGAWYLSMDTDDLGASSNGSLRLYMNTSHPAVKEMLSTPGSPSAQTLANFVHYDVARQLVVQALLHEDLDEEGLYDPDSLGDMFLNLLGGLFPDRDLQSLRGDFRSTPGELEAELQGRLGLMAE